MAELTVTLQGAEDVARRFGRAAEARWIVRMLTRLALRAERAAREGAPRDTSALVRDIAAEVRPLEARVRMPRNLTYFSVMELGRRPGGRMPPPDALAGWARRHGLPTHRGFLFVLARSIARRGIKGRFFMRAARAQTAREMPAQAEAAARELEAEFGRRG